MKRFLKSACASVMALTIAATSLPANARDWDHDGGRGGRGGWGHHHGGGGDGAAIAVGVGILALGLAAAAASSHREEEPRVIYRDRPYANPDEDPYYAPPPPRYGYESGPDCVQTREYQTTIYIDGRPQPAYGAACLLPDGSWLRGPARVAY